MFATGVVMPRPNGELFELTPAENYESVFKDTSLFLELFSMVTEPDYIPWLSEMVLSWGNVAYGMKAIFGSDLVLNSHAVMITAGDNENDEEFTVTAERFIANLLERYGRLAPLEWAEDYDADDVDYWFQTGMFGEIVYG